MKNCKFCAEEIQDEAIVCRFCSNSQNDEIEVKEQKSKGAEIVIHTSGRHWVVYLIPIILMCTIYLIPVGIYYIFYFKNQKIALTNRKFVHEYGILNKKKTSFNNEKIESVETRINIIDAMFGTGSIILTLTGGKESRINTVKAPKELKSAIESVIK